ncbi:MAG: TRAP transporter small permease subunit [Gammaproteobacteria bacterium]|nr:TRAP transporter small permease subunit [Gammaproteobacteria bacterium]
MLSKSIVSLLDKVDFISVWMGKTFAWFSLPMIAVIVYEVISNGVFDKPTDWAHQSSTMFYGTFCMIGAAWTLREKGHVRSEVIYQIMPFKLQKICDVFTGLIVLAMLVILFAGTYEYASESWKLREFSETSTWKVPIYPFKSVMPIAVGLMCIQQTANILRDMIALVLSFCKKSIEIW